MMRMVAAAVIAAGLAGSAHSEGASIQSRALIAEWVVANCAGVQPTPMDLAVIRTVVDGAEPAALDARRRAVREEIADGYADAAAACAALGPAIGRR